MTSKISILRTASFLFYMVAFSILFSPAGFEYIAPFLYGILNGLKTPVAILLIGIAVLKKRSINCNRIMVCLVVFYIYLTIVSLIRGALATIVIKEALIVFSVIMLLNSTGDITTIVSPLLAALEWQIYVNAFLMISIPDGMYIEKVSMNWSCWLLGYDNGWNYIFFPALFLAIIMYYSKGNKLRFWFLLIVMEFQIFTRQSVVCMLGFLVFDVLYIIKAYRGRLNKKSCLHSFFTLY